MQTGTLARLNKTATGIWLAIYEMMISQKEKTDHIRIDNNKPDSGIMPVVMEDIHQTVNLGGSEGKVFSLAHYYEQEGDLMADPEVTFILIDNRSGDLMNFDAVGIYPISFKQASFGLDREDAIIENSKVTRYSVRRQKDNAKFCNGWLKNISFQQNIKPLLNKPNKTNMFNIYKKVQVVASEMGFKSIADAMKAGKGEELAALCKERNIS